MKQWGDALGKMMNMVRAYGQRIAESRQDGNGVSSGPDPETLARLQSDAMLAKGKDERAATTHATKTAQRQVSFEAEELRKEDQHKLDLRKQQEQNAIDLAAQQLKAMQPSKPRNE